MTWLHWFVPIVAALVLGAGGALVLARILGRRAFFGVLWNDYDNDDDWLDPSITYTSTYTPSVGAAVTIGPKAAVEALRETLGFAAAASADNHIGRDRFFRIAQAVHYIRSMGDGLLHRNPTATAALSVDGGVTWTYADPGDPGGGTLVAGCVIQAWHMAQKARDPLLSAAQRVDMWNACIERLEQGH